MKEDSDDYPAVYLLYVFLIFAVIALGVVVAAAILL